MYTLEELEQHLKNCHKSICVDGSMAYMHGFGDGFRAAIDSLACYKGNEAAKDETPEPRNK